jgi:hypothetical protein
VPHRQTSNVIDEVAIRAIEEGNVAGLVVGISSRGR